MALNAERIEKNPGPRALCKLMANSFCVRSESKPIRQVTTCQTADQFFNLSEDYTMIIHGLLPVGDEILDAYHSFRHVCGGTLLSNEHLRGHMHHGGIWDPPEF